MKILGGLYTTGGGHTHTLATRLGAKKIKLRLIKKLYICKNNVP